MLWITYEKNDGKNCEVIQHYFFFSVLSFAGLTALYLLYKS